MAPATTNFDTGLVVPTPIAPAKVDVAVVVVARMFPTVNCGVPVATRLVPFHVTNAFVESPVELMEIVDAVPPTCEPSVPDDDRPLPTAIDDVATEPSFAGVVASHTPV